MHSNFLCCIPVDLARSNEENKRGHGSTQTTCCCLILQILFFCIDKVVDVSARMKTLCFSKRSKFTSISSFESAVLIVLAYFACLWSCLSGLILQVV